MKKTISTITLAMVMTFGATFANAGLLVSDFAAPSNDECSGRTGVIVEGIAGVIVEGIAGVIVEGIAGLLVSDGPSTQGPCTTSTGLLVSD